MSRYETRGRSASQVAEAGRGHGERGTGDGEFETKRFVPILRSLFPVPCSPFARP